MADEPVRGETRWPMAGAVLAAIVLTMLLLEEVRLGPTGRSGPPAILGLVIARAVNVFT